MRPQRLGEALTRLIEDPEALAAVAAAVTGSLERGGKILLAGNGGSAAQAQHGAAELVGRYRRSSTPLPAVALSTDTSTLTALANDFGFDEVFERQVRALARPGDVVVGFSTSGRSPNLIRCLRAAREVGALAVAVTGAAASEAGEAADLVLAVPSTDTARIQELHLLAWHVVCELVEAKLRGNTPERGSR